MSTRNFDHRAVLERQQALQVAQSVYRNLSDGSKIAANPQNSYTSPQLIHQFAEGAQNAYSKGLVAGPNSGVVSVGGIQNILSTQTFPSHRFSLPSPPTQLVATPSATQIQIDFVEGDRGSDPMINYQYSVDGGFTFTNFSPAITTSPVVITGLSSGTPYTLALRTLTSVGASVSSLTVFAVTLSLPSAPTITGITGGNTQLSVAFTAPTSAGSAPITNYEYSINNGVTWTTRSPVSTTSPLLITGLTNGITYSIKIRALNAYGSGAASAAVSGTPSVVPLPSAPTLTSALPGNTIAYVYFTPSGTGQENYEYSLNGGTSWTARSPTDITSPLLITGLVNGVAVSVILRAVNSGGPSAASNSLSVTAVASGSYTPGLLYDETSYSGTGSSVTNQAAGGPTVTGTKSAGVTYVTGTGLASRKVFDFPGANQITFGSYDFGSAFTVVAWVYPRTRFSINGILANVGANQAPSGFKIGWNGWNTSNLVMLFEAGNGVTGSADASVSNTVTLNTWQQLTYIIDKTNAFIYFLKNDAPAPTASYSDNQITSGIGTNNPSFAIGSFTDGSYSMNGQLGSLKVIPRILTVSEVANEYNATKSNYGL